MIDYLFNIFGWVFYISLIVIFIWRMVDRIRLINKKDPVKSCQVYKLVGCAHVGGMLCNMETCDISVTTIIMPTSTKHTNIDLGWSIKLKED